MWNHENRWTLLRAVAVAIVIAFPLCSGHAHLPYAQPKMIAISYQELKEAAVQGEGAPICPSSDSLPSSSSSSSMSSSSCSPSMNARLSSTTTQEDAYGLLLERIEEAFGPHGLGILQVTHVPSTLIELRESVLWQASQLAHLPNDQLEELTVPESDYTIGWSHGKEQFGIDHETNQPIYDTRKGSFYFNPFSVPSQSQHHQQQHPNVFPSTELFPNFEDQIMQLTHFMTEITLWVARLCDAYLEWKSTSIGSRTHSSGSIYESLQSKLNTKARLLYYYASKGDGDSDGKTSRDDGTTTIDTNNVENDDWCGWHKDHGSLTALLPGMLIDESSSQQVHQEHQQDQTTNTNDQPAGLYIQTRNGSSVHVSLPPTSIGIQLGETVEIMSGGKLVATPHAVKSGTRAGSSPRVGRASLAVFTQPMSNQTLPDCPTTADESLRSRYRPTFGAFQQATTQAFQ